MPDGHNYRGIAHEVRLAVICECGWVTGDCFDNLHEMNDHDPCDPCHLAWRVQCLEDDSHGWWNELDRLDSVDELAIRQSEQRDLFAEDRSVFAAPTDYLWRMNTNVSA